MMNQESKVAFVLARVAMLNARIAEMQAANACRANYGASPAYDDYAFASVQQEFCDLEYNNLLSYLRE